MVFWLKDAEVVSSEHIVPRQAHKVFGLPVLTGLFRILNLLKAAFLHVKAAPGSDDVCRYEDLF